MRQLVGLLLAALFVLPAGYLVYRQIEAQPDSNRKANGQSETLGGLSDSSLNVEHDSKPAAGDASNRSLGSRSQMSAFSTSVTRRADDADRTTLSPAEDGWKTEEEAGRALGQLKVLLKTLGTNEPAALTVLDSVLVATPIRPQKKRLKEVLADEMISVRRLDSPLASRSNDPVAFMEDARGSLPFHPQETKLKYHVKIVSVAKEGDTTRTVALVELSQSQDGVSWQSNAKWECVWKPRPNTAPMLTSVKVTSYEESEIRGAAGPWFADLTESVVGGNACFDSQLRHGHHYWLGRIERSHRFDTSVRNGLAIGDANGDGFDDVYVCQPPGLPNRLFIRQPDGSSVDFSAAAGVNWLDQTSAAIFCDLDNDGDQDLAIGTPTGTLLMENDSSGKFQLRTKLEHDYDVQSISAVDYDNDGFLDLFVCVYRTAQQDSNQSFLYRDAVGGGKNRLFRNGLKENAWSFEDVTEKSGLSGEADRYSLAASWEDFDNDGDQDLYIANDFGKNHLYENTGGNFKDIAAEAGVADIGSGMSVSWGDADQDGLIDLYVGNMFSSAGMRITDQPGFRPTEEDSIRRIYRRLAKGNSLFLNNGDKTFREVGREANVELGRWAWSSIFTDLNNDGREDLLVANGYITTDDTGDL